MLLSRGRSANNCIFSAASTSLNGLKHNPLALGKPSSHVEPDRA
jgi:hypothetical protein